MVTFPPQLPPGIEPTEEMVGRATVTTTFDRRQLVDRLDEEARSEADTETAAGSTVAGSESPVPPAVPERDEPTYRAPAPVPVLPATDGGRSQPSPPQLPSTQEIESLDDGQAALIPPPPPPVPAQVPTPAPSPPELPGEPAPPPADPGPRAFVIGDGFDGPIDDTVPPPEQPVEPAPEFEPASRFDADDGPAQEIADEDAEVSTTEEPEDEYQSDEQLDVLLSELSAAAHSPSEFEQRHHPAQNPVAAARAIPVDAPPPVEEERSRPPEFRGDLPAPELSPNQGRRPAGRADREELIVPWSRRSESPSRMDSDRSGSAVVLGVVLVSVIVVLVLIFVIGL